MDKRERQKVWNALREAGLYNELHAFMALSLLKFSGLEAALAFVDQRRVTPKQQPLPLDTPDNAPN